MLVLVRSVYFMLIHDISG